MGNEKIEVLKLLIEQETPVSIRWLAQKRKINYKSAYLAVKKLEEEGVIQIQRIGNTKACTFNPVFNESIYLAEYERRKTLFNDKNFLVLHNHLSRISPPFIILLFGSYAKGTATKHSDIDLLVISENITPIEQELSLLPFNFHITDISYENFLTTLKNKSATVVSEAVKHHIVLIGIEEYYRLLQHAK